MENQMERIKEIAARAEAATPGPWEWSDLPEDIETMPILKAPPCSVMDFGDCTQYYPTEGRPPSEADAEFIAHSREDIPYLLVALKASEETQSAAERILHDMAAYKTGLEAEIARLREALKAYVGAYLHDAPNDCFATGPLTGDPYQDIVACPGCRAKELSAIALSPAVTQQAGGDQ